MLGAVLVASCSIERVTTLAEAVLAVQVSPGADTLRPGESRQLSVRVTGRNGVVLARNVLWTSSETSVVLVSSTGSITALRRGTADITATVEGVSGTARVTVSQDPPFVETLPALNISFTSAELAGTVNPMGALATVTFEYGPTGALGTTCQPVQTLPATTQPVAVRCPLTALPPGWTLHYRVSAENAGGISRGEIRTLTTRVPPPIATTRPATAVTPTAGVLNGAVNPNGFASTVVFEWGPTAGLGLTCGAPASLPAGSAEVSVTCPLAGLAPTTTVHYRVVVSSAGGTVQGATLSFTTPNIPPPSVQTLAAASVTPSGGEVRASVNPQGGPTSARFEWGLTPALGTVCGSPIDVGEGNGDIQIACPIDNLARATTVFYRVVATNAGGTTTGATLDFTTLDPMPPPIVQTLPATAISGSGAVLNAVVTPNGAQTTAWFEWGLTSALGSQCGPALDMGSGQNPVAAQCTLASLAPSTAVFYRIRASNTGGVTAGSTLTFTTTSQSPPTVVTQPATNITAAGGIVHATVNPNGLNTTATFEYGLTSALGSQCAPVLNLGAGTTAIAITCTFTGQLPGTTIHYRVTATSAGGTSTGATLSFTTLAGPPPTVQTLAAISITTSGGIAPATVNPNGFTTDANFEWGYTSSLGQTCGLSLNVGSGTSPVTVLCTFTNVPAGTTIFYRAIASNVNGTSTGATLSFTTLTWGPVIATIGPPVAVQSIDPSVLPVTTSGAPAAVTRIRAAPVRRGGS